MKGGRLAVGDLFCGAGGFSEGFRQAGFQISWAVDDWEPAASTYERNLGVEVIRKDISKIDFRELPRVDVLIGSPPCQPFSLANRGGGGDAAKGLKLVAKFIEAVKILRPDYWIMENVANLRPTLDRAWQLNGRKLTKRDVLRYFAHREILDASHYGVAQTRRRLFSGHYPLAMRQSLEEIPMKKVVYALPFPLAGRPPQSVTDPLYGVTIEGSSLTDHFMDTTLSDEHLQRAEQEKIGHSWGGKMTFPDKLELPSRTICATSQKSGRQAIVIEDPRGSSGVVYRVPTLREMASFQGFPITYQFFASSVGDKQTLIGNAVPPPLARFLALSIRDELDRPYTGKASFELPAELASTPQVVMGHRALPLLRSYHRYVPGGKAYCRVELDNRGMRPDAHPGGEGRHLVEWRSVLYLAYARNYAAFTLDPETAAAVALAVLKSRPVVSPESALRMVVENSVKEFEGEVPDATTLQAVWAGRVHLPHGPDWILSHAQAISERVVGGPNLSSGVRADSFADSLRGRIAKLRDGRELHGKDYSKGLWRCQRVDAYTACSALSLAVAAAFANKGVEWLKRNWNDRYEPDLAPGELAKLYGRDDEKLLTAARRAN